MPSVVPLLVIKLKADECFSAADSSENGDEREADRNRLWIRRPGIERLAPTEAPKCSVHMQQHREHAIFV